MRIKELLEGKKFNDMDWVSRTEDGSELNYDLIEDLIFFMNNDDDTYRRHVYPSVARCVENFKTKKTSPSLFADAVKESYKIYVQKYPIRELPIDLDTDICNEACKKMYEEVCKNISDGRYEG